MQRVAQRAQAACGPLWWSTLACCFLLVSLEYIEDTDRFPGWKGELPNKVGKPDAMDQAPTGNTVGFGELGKVGLQL